MKLADVSRLSGAPAASILNWIKRGLLDHVATPKQTGTGNHRDFSDFDAYLICCFASLTAIGVSAQVASLATSALSRHTFEGGPRSYLKITRHGAAEIQDTAPISLIHLHSQDGGAAIFVDLWPIRARVREAI